MAQIDPRRMTHSYDGELVVFLIGMRINKPWRVDHWWPVFATMPKLLAELVEDKNSGLLGYRTTFGGAGPVMVQYWSSHELLYDYARRPDALHRPAWTEFNRRARAAAGSVGIWHETYQVSQAESIYVGMPTSGLAQATAAIPVGPRVDRAVRPAPASA